MQVQQIVRDDGQTGTDRLVDASEQLEAALESIDVADDRALADAVVDAVRATDRAYRLATGRQIDG